MLKFNTLFISQVTIFGEDAGAASVSILAVSPEANGEHIHIQTVDWSNMVTTLLT